MLNYTCQRATSPKASTLTTGYGRRLKTSKGAYCGLEERSVDNANHDNNKMFQDNHYNEKTANG